MQVHISIKINEHISSLWLWECICKFGVNLLDAGKFVWVYGTTSIENATAVIYYCGLFGKISVEMERADRG